MGVHFCCGAEQVKSEVIPSVQCWGSGVSVQPEIRVLASSSHLSAFLLLSVVIPSNGKSEILGTTTRSLSLLGHPQRTPVKGRHMLVRLSQESLLL